MRNDNAAKDSKRRPHNSTRRRNREFFRQVRVARGVHRRRAAYAATFQRVIGDEYAGKLAVAVHIRRGDACNRWAEPGDGDYADKRPCFRTQHYVDAVVALAERYDKDVAAFVASDSEEAVEEFVSLVPTGRVSVFVQVFDRVRATGKDLPNLGRDTDYTTNFIEARNQRGELDRALTYASIVADLEVLGSCDAIVGTAASWVSRLIFLLIVGNTGRTPPHVFLDQRFGGPADVW